MNTGAIVALGLSAGFATAVWGLLLWAHRRQPLIALSYCLLTAANLLSISALFRRFQDSTFRFPTALSTGTLLILIVLPALLQLVPWLKARKILGR